MAIKTYVRSYSKKEGPMEQIFVNFDDNDWEVVREEGELAHIHYIGKALREEDVRIDIPVGADTYFAFEGCELQRGSHIGKFNAKRCRGSIERMFSSMVIPEGFSFGDNFEVGYVKSANLLFKDTVFPENFSLPDNFDLACKTDGLDVSVEKMFHSAKLSKGFSLGKTFNINNVVYFEGMFRYTTFAEDFSLGVNFISKAMDRFDGLTVDYMFENATVIVGDKIVPLLGENGYSGLPEDYPLKDALEIFKYGLKPKCSQKDEVKSIIDEIKDLINKDKRDEARQKIAKLTSCYLSEQDVLYALKDIKDVALVIEGICLVSPKSIVVSTYNRKKLFPELQDLLVVEKGVSSRYTVGEVRDMLYKKYDANLVNMALVEYLSDQVLV